MKDWIKIENKFESKCIECDGLIQQEEQCLWMEKLGIKHIECPTGIIEDTSQLVIIDAEDKERLGIK